MAAGGGEAGNSSGDGGGLRLLSCEKRRGRPGAVPTTQKNFL